MPTFHELLKEKIEKFNPYHDSKGRFASAGGAASFTYAPGKSKAHDMAIQREKERNTAQALAPTAAQEKELSRIANRTRNLKKEQLRVVDSDGKVVMECYGDKHDVSFKMGDARDNFPGNIVIHNHPSGGTFSSADLSTLGHGPKEMRVAAPEGDYIFKANGLTKAGKPDTYKWYEMRESLEEAELSFKTNFNLKKQAKEKFAGDYNEKVLSHAEKWQAARDRGASMEEQQKYIDAYNKASDAWKAEMQPKIEAEVRRLYTKQYHDFYTENASKYGLEYQFIPKEVKKSIETMEDEIMKASEGDVSLDADFNRTIQEITEEIINNIMKV